VDIRFVFLIIFAFILEIFFLSKELSFKTNDIVPNKVDVEFIHSKTIEIDTQKVNNILICDKIQQLKDKKLFFKPIATLYDRNITKTIISKEAELFDKTNILELKRDVKIVYLNKRLSTNFLKYSLKDSTVLDSDRFILNSDEGVAEGNHLYFDTKKSIIKAKDINYTFYMKE